MIPTETKRDKSPKKKKEKKGVIEFADKLVTFI